MSEILAQQRTRFFARITDGLIQSDVHLLLITHCLSDRPEFIDGLSRLVVSVRIVAIPYSIHEPTMNSLRDRFAVSTPTLDDLHNPDFLLKLLEEFPDNASIIIVEIGGYFASLMSNIPVVLQGRIKGVVEDTEAGHRRYLAVNKALKCGVISVARSPLKEPEDSLVGASCIFSVERIMRDLGTIFDAKSCTVLGYGKIGRSLAKHVRDRGLPVAVYDTNPVSRICAISDGFFVPDRDSSISRADIIFGATGNLSLSGSDVNLMRDGTFLVSCSSKTQEFDLTSLRAMSKKSTSSVDLERLDYDSKRLYITYAGQPINFRDGAVIGPVLYLIQAEIISAVSMIINQIIQCGIHSVPDSVRENLAYAWLAEFVNAERGSYNC